MSRESTQIWTVADNTAQPVEDLRRDWENRRSPTWAIDLAPSGSQVPRRQLDPQQQEERARQIALLAAKADATRQATSGIRAPNLAQDVVAARADLRNALDARTDLERGAGLYQRSEAGRAVRDLQQARVALHQAEHDAQHAPRWRDRRAATKEQALWAQRGADARHRHQLHVTPEVARLDRSIEVCQSAVEEVEAQAEQYRQAENAVINLTHSSSRDVSRCSTHLTIYRNDIDGLPQLPAPTTRPTHSRQTDVATRADRPAPHT